MKIQAINTNSFKGLFADKTLYNNGNWRMEYSPYSWESNNTGKMAAKEKIDVFAPTLPDNEEIYTTDKYAYKTASSKDILGTESYYVTNDGKVRRTITEVPSLNREESLRVLDKKLEKFLKIKQEMRTELEQGFKPAFDSGNSASIEYDSWAREHERGVFDRSYNKSEAAAKMNGQKSSLKKALDSMYENSQKYMQLMGSMDAVRQSRANIQKEANDIAALRSTGRLIDISRRDIVNPNDALQAALQNLKTAAEKHLCLPHKLVSMEEILKIINPKGLLNFSRDEIIRQVETMIKRSI